MSQGQSVPTSETYDLISADKVEGTAVYNMAGEKLGTVKSLMIDKITGQVAYAVMSFGGFLGMGDRYHPLPWSILDYDTKLGGYQVDLDKDRLGKAPSYAATEEPNWADPAYGNEVRSYYGTSAI